ncbi:hypothetical protein ABMA28_010116 [Loxostege sticticalis]|uniref:THAP-type domain-containing protein n=1 Tax=Loxostege sticticalis TaxID=481309 RepID=A0ABD0S9R5_LOXSC
MPSCVVKWCKNNTTSQKKCQGITFHRFPTGNEPWKDDWTRIIRNCRGQEDWSASKSSVVCSIHFDQNYLYTTSKGRRRLVTYATRIKLFMLRHHHFLKLSSSESHSQPASTATTASRDALPLLVDAAASHYAALHHSDSLEHLAASPRLTGASPQTRPPVSEGSDVATSISPHTN